MKAKTSRRDFLKVLLSSLGAAFLAACGRIIKPPAPTSTMTPTSPAPPQPTTIITLEPQGRSTPVPYVTTEPYALYDFADSFEHVSDLGAYGITSAQNSIRVNSADYDTIYDSGHQSIEAYGKIGGSSGSSLSFEFDVKKITGSNSYDFSKKVIIIDVFIPADSPIDSIAFEADSGARVAQVQAFKTKDPSSPPLVLDPRSYVVSLPKGQWVEVVLDIKDVFSGNMYDTLWYASGPNGKLTDAEALEVVRNCDVFKIQGKRGIDGSAVSTSFLLDDLRWLERDSIKIDTSVDSLRKYAANTHLYVGSSAEYDYVLGILDAKFSQVLAQEFNLLMPDPWYWSDMEPSEGVYDFAKDEAILDFAAGNDMAIMGYTGAEHTTLPSWVKNKSFSELQPVLLNYIDTVVRRFQGRIASWVVFNEVVNDNGDGFRNRQAPNTASGMYAYSPWVDGNDTSLIKAAFSQARISDPNAKLILNDFYTEEIGRQKSEFFYHLVSNMVAEGIPIDGVGFEMHITYPPISDPNSNWSTPRVLDLPAYLSKVDANVKRYAALGLQVAFSEVDVPICMKDIDTSTAAGQAELTRRVDYQGQIFGGLMKVALDNPNVIAFKTQDFTDRYSGIQTNSGYGFPDMLDKDYHPKPAYDEVLKALMNRQ